MATIAFSRPSWRREFYGSSFYGSTEQKVVDRGHVCVVCGEPLGLYYEILVGRGLSCLAQFGHGRVGPR